MALDEIKLNWINILSLCHIKDGGKRELGQV